MQELCWDATESSSRCPGNGEMREVSTRCVESKRAKYRDAKMYLCALSANEKDGLPFYRNARLLEQGNEQYQSLLTRYWQIAGKLAYLLGRRSTELSDRSVCILGAGSSVRSECTMA